jgi:hypothetical protein
MNVLTGKDTWQAVLVDVLAGKSSQAAITVPRRHRR